MCRLFPNIACFIVGALLCLNSDAARAEFVRHDGAEIQDVLFPPCPSARSVPNCEEQPSFHPTGQRRADRAATCARDTVGTLGLDLCWPPGEAVEYPGEISALSDASAGRSIEPLPAAPSSLALGLTALVGFGAVQAGRSLRKFHLHDLPEWYHAGGPQQIGHTTVLDVQSWALQPCLFAAAPWTEPTTSRFRSEVGDFSPLHEGEAFLLTAPRAPPIDGR